jgi:hypothetical protein
MKHYFTPFLIGFSLFIISSSCTDEKTKASIENEHDQQSENATSKEEIPGMALNDGKKWPMDDHTRSAFKKMAVSFKISDFSSINGLRKTGTQLKEQVGKLIQGCTMDGDAHNQLHIFLTGYIPAVDSLAVATTMDSGWDHSKKINQYLSLYSTYFE